MQLTALKPETLRPYLEYGTIMRETSDQGYRVSTNIGIIDAGRADACLIKPSSGDMVLLCLDESGGAFILSVLKKSASAAGTEIHCNGDLKVRAEGGSLRMVCDREVSVAAGEEISLVSREIYVHAEQSEAVIGRFAFLGKVLTVEVERIRTVARSVEQLFHTLSQRMYDKFSFIKDQYEVQASSSRQITEETLVMQSKNAVHMAEEIVTINAEQIHMG